MASSKTEISNQALTLIGADTIASLTEESENARTCSNNFQPSLDSFITSHPWKCAIKRSTLAALSTAPDFEYTAQFQLPADCLRLLRIYDLPTSAYRVEGRNVLADESSLKVVYLKQITDVSEMQPHVTEAFVHFLAYRIAYRLRPDTQDTMYRIYRDVLSRSKFYDGSQNPVEVLEPNHLLEARLDGTQL